MCQPDVLRKRTRGTVRDKSITSNTFSTAATSETGYALTRKVVAFHNTTNDAWITHNGNVYDITMFLESHPGGYDILLDKLGGDVTDIMKGSNADHQHSAFAYKLLSKYKIGELLDARGDEHIPDGNTDPLTGKPLVHWDQPILHQVGMLGDKYDRWIHSFPTTDHSIQMFTNDTIEMLTKCPWYVPLVFWLPILTLEMVHYVYLMDGAKNISMLNVLVMGFVGGICWLLFEYSLHRFIFHLPTTGYYGNIFHFIIHGHHHITPMDFDRLVFPPVPALILAFPFWYFGPRVLGTALGYPWMLGMLIGYLIYDMTHFWIHHAVPKNNFLKMQKRRHVHHHYFQPQVNFGISNPLFDYVFNTIREPEQ